MDTKCPVALFISHRIQVVGKAQTDIAREAGFERPNMVTMIKQGKTKVPMAKIGSIAAALETDPVALVKLCISTYYPETWGHLEEHFESALTREKLVMVKAWRTFVGTPYLAALSDEQKRRLNGFLNSLRTQELMN